MIVDAHVHLHDARLRALFAEEPEAVAADVSLLNGTSPRDWAAVAAMKPPPGRRFYRAFGVHPWKANGELEDDWEDHLRQRLASADDVLAVGEIGLDRWIEPREETLQEDVFRRQLRLAGEFRLVPVIHCLRAWDALLRILGEEPLPARGFHVHGFGGSLEVQRQLLELGAYFSFSAYALAPHRKRMRKAVAACPEDRLLLETDAPDMAPGTGMAAYPLIDTEGNPLHDPREILTACRGVAELRGMEEAELRRRLETNFRRLYGEAEACQKAEFPKP
ncbi:MAG: TatD family deoxyribonuclease [Verrucomicrobia bacterium]|jgi:TatD DNase family protein|nr:TatD family deoxyribonuclease [Verrucomicrobiota bacterium]